MASFFHIYRPEGVNSKYRLIIFDDSKEAFIPLTEFYHGKEIGSVMAQSFTEVVSDVYLKKILQ